MQHFDLPPRLCVLARMVPDCDTLADVGTERAALPAALLAAGRCRRAIAIDRSRPALAAARQMIAERGLSDRCELRLGNGLAPLAAGEAGVVVIAGVGARLMTRMLTAELPRLAGHGSGGPVLVCQPMSEPRLVREWLLVHGPELGIPLVRETLALDAGRFYHIMVAGRMAVQQAPVLTPASKSAPAGRSGAVNRVLDRVAAEDLGPFLLDGPDPLLGQYIGWRRRSLRLLAARAEAGGAESGLRRARAARLLEAALARTQRAIEHDPLE
jgi:tRNA (adenine22-N1)-methyltransferase